MKKGLFARKSIGSLLKEASDNKHGLKRSLGPLNLMAMGIGAIIGAGLFVITGDVAANYTGPGVIISFIIAAFICSLAALCYAEFASLIPIAGSAYTYAYVSMGEFFAWIMGLSLTLAYLFSFSTIAVGWSGYFSSLLKDVGIQLPKPISTTPIVYSAFEGWTTTGAIINLPAIAIVGLIGFLVSRGMKSTAFLNNLLVIVKVGVIFLFIVCGLAYIKAENLTPMIPENTGIFGEYGWSGILRGSGILFFAFLGFDVVSTLAQETKNPQKNIPIGMLGSLAICAVLYILFAFVMTGVLGYKSLGVSDPIAAAVEALGPGFTWLRVVVNLCILCALTSVILVMIMAQSRIFFAMAQDGLIPKAFGVVHKKYRTPFFATICVTLSGMILAGFFPVGLLGQLTSMGALLVFGMVCFGVLLLRFLQPALHRPFKTPFTPWLPLVGTVACFLQMLMMPAVVWLQMIAFLGLGCLIYVAYGSKHSRVRNKF
jgi:APA family basic amino acid/polyamine antiporter